MRKKINNPMRHEVVSIHQLSKITITFWLGGIWTIGIIIIPILFRTLDPVTASYLAGQILSISAYIGIVSLLIAFVEVMINHKLALIKTRRFWYIITMGSMLIINYFAIFPMIAHLRKTLSTVAHEIIAVQNNVFDFWHSLSALIFVVICIIGVLYLLEM